MNCNVSKLFKEVVLIDYTEMITNFMSSYRS